MSTRPNNLYVMQASCDQRDEPYPLAAYRDITRSLLRRYAAAATQMGHLPCLLGRCFFRAKVTSFTVHTFEDGVNFVLDVERALEVLHERERKLIATIVFEGQKYVEAGRIMNFGERNIYYALLNAIDHFTEVLLERGLLNESMIHVRERTVRESDARPDLRFRRARLQRDAVRRQSQPGKVVSIDACQTSGRRVFAASA